MKPLVITFGNDCYGHCLTSHKEALVKKKMEIE